MDEMTWGALALVLTLVGALYTWWAFTRRGTAPGVRGVALTMLPPAAWLTGTLEMFTEIAGSVADWAGGLVLSPAVWVGLALAGSSALLLLVSRLLPARTASTRQGRPTPQVEGGDRRPLPPGRPATSGPVVDDEMAEIEAILKRRGIS